MVSHVGIEEIRLYEGPITLHTLVRLFEAVDRHVPFQRPRVCVRLKIRPTFERFFARVDHHVSFQIAGVLKQRVALGTRIWLFTRVDPRVPR